MEDRAQGKQASLSLLEGESPATTGIKAPVTSKHLNANTLMSAIALGAEELTDGPSVQSGSLNQELSRGQRFREHFVWDPAAAVRSMTICWTKFPEPLPSLPAFEFDNLEILATIQSHSHLFALLPINIDHFQSLLSFYPNQPFVGPVC